MSWFTNLRTRSKLLLGYGFLCVLLIGLAVTAYRTLATMERIARDEIGPTDSAALALTGARADLNRIRGRMFELFLTMDESQKAAIQQDIAERAEDIKTSLAAVKTFLAVKRHAEDLAFVADLEKRLAVFLDGRAEAARLILAGKTEDARALLLGVQHERFESIRAALMALSRQLQKYSSAAAEESERLFTGTVRILVAVSLLAVLFAVSMIWLMNRLIAAPLAQTVKMVQDIRTGQLGNRLKMARRDEIGVLAGAMDQLADAVNAVVADVAMLTRASVEGKLSTRADAGKHPGDFRTIVQGFNDTLDAVIRPLNAAAAIVDRIARDDIPKPIVDEYQGDFNVLKNNLNKMIANLRGLLSELQSGFGVLATSSTEILSAVSQVAASAAEVATAVTETSATTEEVKQTAHLASQTAKTVQETARKASAVSETGRKAVIETFDGMSGIREQMESIAEGVVRLSEQGQAIGEIIATVNDLAEQSNLLAVNAAIEATRAGEYGKGFAVVAQEVRSLAEQSRQATTQVRTILMEVQKATSAAVMATEQGTKAVAAGVKQATDAGEATRDLTGGVNEAALAASQVAASVQQQLIGMEQIASAIANIRQATGENLASTRQLEGSAKSLQELGGRLRALVEKQRVEA
ncbi:MAG: methyl-accepting chemotaxis protein [Holophagales bacterium]|nr:methyl-accepting chemotaxis protein [Holophagales bacterium]